jgi:hypothetical protein
MFELYKNDFYTTENLGTQQQQQQNRIKSELTREDLMKFKQDLIACLNPNFMKRCVDLEQKIESARKDNFISILIKRIQRLIHLHN